MKNNHYEKPFVWANLLLFVVIAIIAVVDTILYACLGNGTAFVVMFLLNLLFIGVAAIAYATRLVFLDILIAIAGFILFFVCDNFETSLFNAGFLALGIVSGLGACSATVFYFLAHEKSGFPKSAWIASICCLALALGSGLGYGIPTASARQGTDFHQETLAVPQQFDAAESAHAGSLEVFSYQTKAYATDQRELNKQAYVYLPYGYDAVKSYDILYLLHGTGDNEAYWMKDFSYNKIMLDHLIEQKLIEPMIIAMPTFYDEKDCLDDLDKLTYSFKDEIRNDLVPAVEGHYSTYAVGTNSVALKASRAHRGFAGLSRGAVTTLRSALCGNLDYFSKFGLFSASRLPEEYYRSTAISGDFASLSIDYFFMTSGSFDFSLATQVRDYRLLRQIDSRIIDGKNSQFVVFPLCHHSMASWHIALYDFLEAAYRSKL